MSSTGASMARCFCSLTRRSADSAATRAASAFAAVVAAALAARADEKTPVRFDFEADTPGEAPKGFEFGRTGEGRPGKWVVRAEEGAPTGKHALVQTDADDTDNRFCVAFTGPEL